MDEKNNFENANQSPRERRSIRDIPLTKKQTKELEQIEERMTEDPSVVPMTEAPLPRPTPPRPRSHKASKESSGESKPAKRKKKGTLAWFLLAVIVLVLVYGIGHVFAKATVSITRSQEVVMLSDNSFTLVSASSTTATASTAISPVITYKQATINVSTSTSISASGQQTIQKKATGKVVVYNDSSSSQVLVANTRFQTSSGLIFRLNNDVTVSAKTNVTVAVTADQAGDKYNIGATSFTLPGLQGTAKYKTVYAKSSSSMSGGSVTTMPQTKAGDLTAAKTALQVALQSQIADAEADQAPDGYTTLDGASSIVYGTVKQTYNSSSKSAVLTQNATAVIYYLENNSLESALASKSSMFATASNTSDIYSANADMQSLTGKVTGNASSIDVSGTSTIEASYNPDQISQHISGLSRKSALDYIESLPGVETAEISIKPWWEFKLPKPASVKIEIQ